MLVLIVSWLWYAAIVCFVRCEVVTINIVHSNDVHARVDPCDPFGGICASKNFSGCFGGISRHLAFAKRVRREHPGTSLFLNSGDYFQGSIWCSELKGKFMAAMVDIMKHEAITLGNHEFDHKTKWASEYIAALKTPILGSNLDFSHEPLLEAYPENGSMIVERAGQKIGLIGYLTPETIHLSNPSDKIVFNDEIECIRKEVKKLQKQNVRIIIAMGHSGYEKDMEIALKIPEVSVVVGGHSHTFLDDHQNGPDIPLGPYPTIIERADGSKCPVVQVYWLGKYIGRLDVTFDVETGNALNWTGVPVLLDDTFPTDPEMDEFLSQYRPYIEKLSSRVIGSTAVFLAQQNCSFSECNIGNFMADSLVHWYAGREPNNGWGLVSGAFVNSGGIRGSINEQSNNGLVTYGDLVMVMPFQNQIWIINVTGDQLYYIFEQSIRAYEPKPLMPNGAFYQVSGIKVVYDVSRPVWNRVVSLHVRCRLCRVPRFEPVCRTEYYQIATYDFIINGGDNTDYSFLTDDYIYKDGTVDSNATQYYFSRVSPVWTGLEGRITMLNTP